jgi:ATP-binding cassette subfamily F protein 3
VKSIAARLPLLNGKRSRGQSRDGLFQPGSARRIARWRDVLEHVRDLEPDWAPPKLRSLAARMGFGVEKIDTKVRSFPAARRCVACWA